MSHSPLPLPQSVLSLPRLQFPSTTCLATVNVYLPLIRFSPLNLRLFHHCPIIQQGCAINSLQHLLAHSLLPGHVSSCHAFGLPLTCPSTGRFSSCSLDEHSRGRLPHNSSSIWSLNFIHARSEVRSGAPNSISQESDGVVFRRSSYIALSTNPSRFLDALLPPTTIPVCSSPRLLSHPDDIDQ